MSALSSLAHQQPSSHTPAQDESDKGDPQKEPSGARPPSSQQSSLPQFGLTRPASVEVPTPVELHQNDLFLQRVVNHHESGLDTAAAETARKKVVQEITQLLHRWLLTEVVPDQPDPARFGMIAIQGSMALGCCLALDSDIDLTALVVGKAVSTQLFFEQFPKFILDFAPQTANVADVHVIWEVDLKLCRVRRPHVSVELVQYNKCIRFCDGDNDVRGLVGSFIAASVLRHIPSSDVFSSTCRVIKHWAIQRGVYGKRYGYFSGLAWAILVARACQLYPTAPTYKLVRKVFRMLAMWPFPSPVVLCKIKDLNLDLEVWEPTYNDVTPIITPSYPSDNCAGTVSPGSWQIIRDEVDRALKICDELMAPSPPAPAVDTSNGGTDAESSIPTNGDCNELQLKVEQLLPKLAEPSTFLSDFPAYLIAEVSATDRIEYLRWVGLVDSRIRYLASNLRTIPTLTVRLFPRKFRATDVPLIPAVPPAPEEKGATSDQTGATDNVASVSANVTPPEDGNSPKVTVCRWVTGLRSNHWSAEVFAEIEQAILDWKENIRAFLHREQKTFRKTDGMKGPELRMVQADEVFAFVED